MWVEGSHGRLRGWMSTIFGVRYTCLDCGAGFEGETDALLHTLRIAHFDFADTEDADAIYTPLDDPEFGISLSRDDLTQRFGRG